ncbi:MAG: Fe-S cluster assembly sulfur transfer protein SufU [Planctomycetota bacterium]|jgi:nitrogen fixation NifU-like protein
MNDLHELYQELILDHNRTPRNFGRPEASDREAVGYNPLCGDRVTVYVTIRDDVVEDVAFEGSGCAISTAAASMMTEAIKGKTISEARRLFEKFHELVAGPAPEDESAAGNGPGLGKLAAFAGVRRFPARVKCATLVWHTLNAALENKSELVTTE